MTQITSIEFFSYKGFGNKRWALAQMRDFHVGMADVAGLTFYKLLGSGAGNGFSLWPDFGTFCLLTVWEDIHHLKEFREKHSKYREMHSRSVKWKGAKLKAVKGHGTWNNKQPFEMHGEMDSSKPLAVITRASIDKRKAIKFWRRVPGVSRYIQDLPGLIYAKGVGELPLVEQATISFWEGADVLQDFAYGKNGKHRPMVKMTREVGWYTEEMFMRFQVLEWEGDFV